MSNQKRIAELREIAARAHRRMQRIGNLQSKLHLRRQVASVEYEHAMSAIWHIENGLKLRRNASDFSEHDAERATALLFAFKSN